MLTSVLGLLSNVDYHNKVLWLYMGGLLIFKLSQTLKAKSLQFEWNPAEATQRSTESHDWECKLALDFQREW